MQKPKEVVTSTEPAFVEIPTEFTESDKELSKASKRFYEEYLLSTKSGTIPLEEGT